MQFNMPRALGAAKWAIVSACVVSFTGCASFYVDTALPDVKSEDIKKPATPKPVQLLFSFQSKGAANAAATNLLKAQVTDLVKASGLFSTVSDTPEPNVLSITLNNIPLTEDAASKGFMTGFTFGLAGSTVTDGYVCTVDYLPDANAPKLSYEIKHALHTGLGAGSAPPGLKPAASLDEAVRTMTRQAVNNGLKKLADDSRFNGGN